MAAGAVMSAARGAFEVASRTSGREAGRQAAANITMNLDATGFQVTCQPFSGHSGGRRDTNGMKEENGF